MELLFGIAIGIFLREIIRAFRPSAEWQPEANTDDDYKRAAYKAAAKTLGVRIKFGPPVPCPAGTAACFGMTGIWLHRDDAKKLKRHEFTNAMFREYDRIAH